MHDTPVLSFQELVESYDVFSQFYCQSADNFERFFDATSTIDGPALRAAFRDWERRAAYGLALHASLRGRLSGLTSALIAASTSRKIITYKLGPRPAVTFAAGILVVHPDQMTGLAFASLIYVRALESRGQSNATPFNLDDFASAARHLAANPNAARSFRRILGLKRATGFKPPLF